MSAGVRVPSPPGALDPCPFCRQAGFMRRYRWHGRVRREAYTVECAAPGCPVYVETKFAATPDDAAALWNARKPEVPCHDSSPECGPVSVPVKRKASA